MTKDEEIEALKTSLAAAEGEVARLTLALESIKYSCRSQGWWPDDRTPEVALEDAYQTASDALSPNPLPSGEKKESGT